jgi:hypothetical protein
MPARPSSIPPGRSTHSTLPPKSTPTPERAKFHSQGLSRSSPIRLPHAAIVEMDYPDRETGAFAAETEE